MSCEAFNLQTYQSPVLQTGRDSKSLIFSFEIIFYKKSLKTHDWHWQITKMLFDHVLRQYGNEITCLYFVLAHMLTSTIDLYILTVHKSTVWVSTKKTALRGLVHFKWDIPVTINIYFPWCKN